MIRLQIQLDPDRARELRRAAEEDGVSQAEVVRRAVGVYLKERRLPNEAAVQRAVALIGKGTSGRPDLAEDHDRYFAEAISERISGRAVRP
ncbi:MAG: ribbon-helix-helix protein, CopG family [Thermoleophilia bacterium]